MKNVLTETYAGNYSTENHTFKNNIKQSLKFKNICVQIYLKYRFIFNVLLMFVIMSMHSPKQTLSAYEPLITHVWQVFVRLPTTQVTIICEIEFCTEHNKKWNKVEGHVLENMCCCMINYVTERCRLFWFVWLKVIRSTLPMWHLHSITFILVRINTKKKRK